MSAEQKTGEDAQTGQSEMSIANALGKALTAFNRGDFSQARRLLREKEADTTLSESARGEARRLVEATQMDRAPLLVGLACLAFIALIVIVTLSRQP